MIQALEGLTGVKRANANHPEKKAVVVYNTSLVTLEQMKGALLRIGYVVLDDIKNKDHETAKLFISEKEHFRKEDLVCFCFGYTRNDIEQDFFKNGRSIIIAKIAGEKKTGGCDCATKNPKGL